MTTRAGRQRGEAELKESIMAPPGEESPFSLYPDILRAYPGLTLLRDNQIKRLISGIYVNNRMVQQALECFNPAILYYDIPLAN